MLKKNGTFYQSARFFCAKKGEFGESCSADNECQTGLFCSSRGALKKICLKGEYGTCGANNECVNLLPCINGMCLCPVIIKT